MSMKEKENSIPCFLDANNVHVFHPDGYKLEYKLLDIFLLFLQIWLGLTERSACYREIKIGYFRMRTPFHTMLVVKIFKLKMKTYL